RVQQDTDHYESQVIRLETDAEAVKIITIHGSKGLEYPIVFCPDLWVHGKKHNTEIALFTKGKQSFVDLGSEDFDVNKKLQNHEESAEALRLLYVAVTRAKYRCIVYWASQNNPRSSLAHIIKQHPGQDWLQRLSTLAAQHPENIEYKVLASDVELTPHYSHQVATKEGELRCRTLQRELNPKPWVMSSYSGLAYHSVDTASLPELPVDKSEENEPKAPVVDELPKGAHTGNLIHDLLEFNSFASLGEASVSEDYIELRDAGIKRYAGDSHFETDLVDGLLNRTVNTQLSTEDSHFTLANLSDSQCLKEMPFYFKVEAMQTHKINQLLAHDPAYLELNRQQMHGQLTGFIDLICEYQGQYYVMDYKTNYLEQYTTETMTRSMHEHNYGLQYWIYSLVLHRYLQQTLEGYDFNQHFGGVRYLFVRGMNPDTPCSGVYEYYPSLSVLEELAVVFNDD
ncbi:MAG TPA: exodeoxyribonuclease V subunit beta, partial [Thiotrichaceae bacterium]|nr:exodeoxyribonuclease V subunit beta [Thiotrichaceae bacterium]